jgi:hypothetical protein
VLLITSKNVNKTQENKIYFFNIDLHSRTGRDETKRMTEERMERRSRKRYSSVGSEKMERVGDR